MSVSSIPQISEQDVDLVCDEVDVLDEVPGDGEQQPPKTEMNGVLQPASKSLDKKLVRGGDVYIRADELDTIRNGLGSKISALLEKLLVKKVERPHKIGAYRDNPNPVVTVKPTLLAKVLTSEKTLLAAGFSLSAALLTGMAYDIGFRPQKPDDTAHKVLAVPHDGGPEIEKMMPVNTVRSYTYYAKELGLNDHGAITITCRLDDYLCKFRQPVKYEYITNCYKEARYSGDEKSYEDYCDTWQRPRSYHEYEISD